MPLYKVGAVYYVDLPTANGRLRRSARTTSRQEAQAYHDKLKGDLWRLEKLGEKPPVTWGEAVKKWMAVKPRGMPDRYQIRAFGISENTTLPLSETSITTALGSAKSPGTWNRRISLLKAIHSTSGIIIPAITKKASPPGRTRWLSAEEWEKLKSALQKLSPLLALCAEFAINTGLRENNVLNLEWSQVDLKRRAAWIHGDQAKAGLPIGVPLNEGAMAVLEARRGLHKVFCFANPDTGLPYVKASNRAWYEALRKAKLVGVRWHDLRHTWASWAVMSGVRLEELMTLGGWKSYSMVKRYAHLSTEHLAAVSAKIKPVSMRQNKPKNDRKMT